MRFFPLMLKLSKQETIIVNNLLHISGRIQKNQKEGAEKISATAQPCPYRQHKPDYTLPLERWLVTMVFRINSRKRGGGGGGGLPLNPPRPYRNSIYYIGFLCS